MIRYASTVHHILTFFRPALRYAFNVRLLDSGQVSASESEARSGSADSSILVRVHICYW